jgi:hypothetical protein
MDQFLLRLPKCATKRKRILPLVDTHTLSDVAKASRIITNTQMYLDFGQTSFGATQTCPKCSLVYVISESEDVKVHGHFCDQVYLSSLLSYSMLT